MKTLILIFSLLFVNTSYADHIDSITIINNGKPGGSFNARTQLYKQGLEDKGYHVDYLDVGKISQAVKMFKESIDPTIMVYANNQVFKQDLFHTDQNFVLLEYQQPLYICSAKKIFSDPVTVAHGKGYDPDLIRSILGEDIVLVPYKNSGAMLKGILGGDVDMMINNQGKSLTYMESGEGTCEASDKLPTMQATVIARNVHIQEIRELLLHITLTDNFVDYHVSRKLQRPYTTFNNRETELDYVKELESQWKH